jgi:hypothetical protein
MMTNSPFALVARIVPVVFAALIFCLSPLHMNGASAQDSEFKQVALTEKNVQGFIAAQKDLSAISGKLQNAGDKPDPQLQGELEGIAKKHGFASFEELDDIAANISMVMAGIDPETGAFTDPVDSIKKEMAEIKGDTSIPDKDKKQMLDEMEDALKMTPPLKYPANIELVKKYRAEIDKALQ